MLSGKVVKNVLFLAEKNFVMQADTVACGERSGSQKVVAKGEAPVYDEISLDMVSCLKLGEEGRSFGREEKLSVPREDIVPLRGAAPKD